MTRDKPVAVRLPVSLDEQLHQLAQTAGVPVGALVALALAMWLARERARTHRPGSVVRSLAVRLPLEVETEHKRSGQRQEVGSA